MISKYKQKKQLGGPRIGWQKGMKLHLNDTGWDNVAVASSGSAWRPATAPVVNT